MRLEQWMKTFFIRRFEESAKAARINFLCVQYVDVVIKKSGKTDKAVSWTPSTSRADGIEGADALPLWGTPFKKALKLSWLANQLEAAEQKAADSASKIVDGTPEQGTIPPQGATPQPNGLPVESSPAQDSIQASCRLLSTVGDSLRADLSALQQERRRVNRSTPVSDGTPLVAETLLSATTSSLFARLLLNASTFSSVPHGHLPVYRTVDSNNLDMYSMDHRISLGAAGHLWYLSIDIDYV
jgi:hypothetical protein